MGNACTTTQKTRGDIALTYELRTTNMLNSPEAAKHDAAQTAEVRETSESMEAANAGYSSAEQARAATELAKMWQAHKAIDTELAGRAKAMLREMVDGGGDIDVTAVQSLLDEAQRRYAVADGEVTETRPRVVTVVEDNSGDPGSEEVTLPLPPRVEPAKVRYVPPPLPTPVARPTNDVFAGPAPSERGARVVDTSPQETGPVSVERQTLAQQRVEAMRRRDVIQVRLRTADGVQRSRLEQEQKDADMLLAQIEAKMKLAA